MICAKLGLEASMRTQSRYLVNKQQYYQQFSECGFWLAALSQEIDEVRQQMDRGAPPESCLADLINLQDIVFAKLVHPIDYVDVVLDLLTEVIEKQQANESIQLPGLMVCSDSVKYRYYAAVAAHLTQFLHDFTDEYAQWLPAISAHQAALKHHTAKNMPVIIAHLEAIPRIYAREINLHDWHSEFERLVTTHVPPGKLKKYLLATIATWVDNFTFLTEQVDRDIEEVSHAKKFNVAPLLKTLGTVAILSQQFTAAAACETEDKHQLVEMNQPIPRNEPSHLILMAGDTGLALSRNYQVNIAHVDFPDTDSLKKRIRQAIDDAVELSKHTYLQKLNEHIYPLTNTDIQRFLKESVYGSSIMGFMPNVRMRFKHYSLDDEQKLAQDNYLFVAEAAHIPFGATTIPQEMLSQLIADLRCERPDKHELITALRQLDDKALFRVAYAYSTGNDLIKQNTDQALRWAGLAMQRGNLWAPVYIYEQTSQAGFNPQALACLHLAAVHGHSYASFQLGKLHQEGKVVRADTKLAQAYYLQAYLQFPYSLHALHAAIAITQQRIEAYFPEDKVPSLTFADFAAAGYVNLYKAISEDSILLKSLLLSEQMLTNSRIAAEHVAFKRGQNRLLKQSHQHFFIRMRKAQQAGNDLLERLTLNLDGTQHTLPPIEKMEAFGIQCLPWSVNATPGYIDNLVAAAVTPTTKAALRELAGRGSSLASCRIADCYVSGDGFPKNSELAEYFYRQAIQQQPSQELQQKIYDKLKKLIHIKVKRIARVTIQNFFGDLFFDEIQKSLQLNKETLEMFGYQLIARPTLPYRDRSTNHFSAFFTAEAIENTRAIPDDLLESLAQDAKAMDKNIQLEMLASYSALLDGDYQHMSVVAHIYYQFDAVKCLRWNTLSAEHGNALGMYMTAKIYAEGLSAGKTRIERNVQLAVKYMAKAASAGLGLASHSLISSMRFDGRYVNLFVDQAAKQDPQFADKATFLFPNRTGFQLAADTRGVGPLHVDTSHLAWFPVSRTQPAVIELWRAFKRHHPNQDYSERLYVGFLAGDKTCYLTIAKWYDALQGEVDKYQHDIFINTWAMLGFRDGHLPATTYFAINTYLLNDKNINMPYHCMILISDTFFRYKEQLQQTMNNHHANVTPFGTLLARLGVQALYYAAYHGDYAASELLADTSQQHPWLQETARLNFRRTLYAQAIHQGSLRAITYTHFVSTTTALIDGANRQVTQLSCANADNLLTSAIQVDVLARGMLDVCDYIDACLSERQASVDLADHRRHALYKEYLADNLQQRQRLQFYPSLQASLQRFKSQGLRILLGYHPYHTSDKMMRPRAEWEWRDVIPELCDPTFTMEQQPRTETLQALYQFDTSLLVKLADEYLTDPEDMLALRAFLLEEGFTKLGEAWLQHAARTGDRIANRILGMQTRNHELLSLASAYGDPIALAYLLNRTDLDDNVRALLRMQAAHPVADKRLQQRTLHAGGHLIKPRASFISRLDVGKLLAASIGMAASAGVLLYKAIQSKRATSERDALAKLLPAISRQMDAIRQQFTLLKTFPHVEALLIDEQHRFEIRLLPWPLQAMPKVLAVRPLSLTPSEFAANKPQLKIVTQQLQKMHGIHIDDKQILSALGLHYRNTTQLLTYTEEHKVEKFRLATREHLSLFEGYLDILGFSTRQVVVNSIGETILSVTIPTDWECTPWQIFMSKILLTVSLRLYQNAAALQHERMQQELEIQKSRLAANHYLQQIDVLEKRTAIIALHKELDNKYQFICDHSQDKREMDLMARTAKNCLLNCDDALALVCHIPKYLEEQDNTSVIAFVEKLKKTLRKISPDDTEIHKLEQLYHRLHKANAKMQHKNHVAALPVVVAPPPLIVVEEPVVAAVPTATKPPKEKMIYPDVHEIDFSQCLVVTPKAKVSESGQFGVRQRSKKQPKYKGWLKREMATRINGMNVLLENNAFQLKRLETMHFYALHYRFLRLHLLINLLNRAENTEIPADNLLRNKIMDDFSHNMVNGLMHNYFRVGREDLIQCVNECYRDKAIYSKTCEAVKTSDLYRLVCPAEGEHLVLPRSNTELLSDFNHALTELQALFKTSQEKFEDPLLYPGYLDACRMLLMIIGEICQRLDFADCHLHPEFQFILTFLHDCRLVVRNPDKHREDIRARFEAAILSITFVVENYTVEDLRNLVARGIDLITKNDALLAAFTQHLMDKDRQLVYK